MRFFWKKKGKRTFHGELCLWTRRNSCRSAPVYSFYHSFFCQNSQKSVKEEFIKVDNYTEEHFIEFEPELLCWVWPGWQASPFSQECRVSVLFSGGLFWFFSYPVEPCSMVLTCLHGRRVGCSFRLPVILLVILEWINRPDPSPW